MHRGLIIEKEVGMEYQKTEKKIATNVKGHSESVDVSMAKVEVCVCLETKENRWWLEGID